jgi:hypothetical protein
VTICHLEITIIGKKEATATGQVKRQDNVFFIHLEMSMWNSFQK